MISSTTQKQDLSDDVASKLLCLAHLMLASGSLDVTLPVAVEFFTSTITTLMIYSTEGTQFILYIDSGDIPICLSYLQWPLI